MGRLTKTFFSLILFACLTRAALAIIPFGFVSSQNHSPTPTPTATPRVPTPTYSPGAGSYFTPNGHMSVTLSVAQTGAHIFYTTSGSDPTHTGDVAGAGTTRIGANSGVLDVSGTVTYKSLGYQSGYTDSIVATATYSIFGTGITPTPTPSGTPTPTPTPTTKVILPTLSPAPGEYDLNPPILTVTMATTTVGAHLFYTTNGTTPTHSGDTATGSTVRIGSNSGGVSISGTKTIKVIGYLSGFTDSDVKSGDYIVIIGGG